MVSLSFAFIQKIEADKQRDLAHHNRMIAEQLRYELERRIMLAEEQKRNAELHAAEAEKQKRIIGKATEVADPF